MIPLFRTPRTMEDLALFARHVAGAMSARVPLHDILRAYLLECEKGRLARAVEEMADRVESGVELSVAMESHSDVFPLFVRRLVRLGEQGHTLGPVMHQLADTLDEGLKSYELTRRATIYPLIVCLLLFVMFLGYYIFIFPSFTGIFNELGVDLHSVTEEKLGFRVSLDFVIWGMSFLLLVPITFLLGASMGLKVRGFGPGRRLLHLPLIGPVVRLSETARFAHHLALLVENRLPMAESLSLLADTSTNGYVQDAIRDFQKRYESGERLGDLLSSQPLFPPGMAVLVASAEDQGGLAEALRKLGNYYNERTAHGITVIREVLEPLLLVLVGVMVSLVLFTLYSPLFNLPKTIQ